MLGSKDLMHEVREAKPASEGQRSTCLHHKSISRYTIGLTKNKNKTKKQ